MKVNLIFLSACLMLSSCGTASLYYWGGNTHGTTAYEHLAYKSYEKQTPESICKLIAVYENIINNPKGTRKTPPPGICAEYGYLLLQPETAVSFAKTASSSQKGIFDGSDYDRIFRERGEEMMKKEIELYPESERFMLPLIKRFTE